MPRLICDRKGAMASRIFLLLLSALLLTSCATRPQSRTLAPPELLQLEERWNRAHLTADIKTLDELWADDITIIVPKMRSLGKREALAIWRSSSVRFTRYQSLDIKIHDAGDAAIVTGRIDRVRDFGGQTAEDKWQFTKVYVREGIRWRVSAFQASEAPD